MKEKELMSKDKKETGDIKRIFKKGSFLHRALDLSERILSLEIEQKNSKEIMISRFEAIDKRFEAIDKRFEDQKEYMNKRFEAMEKRFDDQREYMDKRFEAVDKRFSMLITLISIGFVIIGTLMSVYKFID